MPRHPRPPTTKKSEHWIRVLVNSNQSVIDSELERAFGWGEQCFQWLSPIASDEYAEYSDDAFLQRLGIAPRTPPLRGFWPSGGPHWDALAKTASGKVILVEAKAYIEESYGGGCGASDKSKTQILKSLSDTKKYLQVRPDAIWDNALYQYANRLSHLYYLKVLNNIDAYLVFVYFLNAPDVSHPSGLEHWIGANRAMKTALGLGEHRLSTRVADIYVDANSL